MGRIFPIIAIAAFGGLTFACPSSETLQRTLADYIPVEKVLSVKPLENLPGFCAAEIEVIKGTVKKRYTIFTDEEGKYAFPFIGEMEVKEDKPSGFKKVLLKSLRKGEEYPLGWIFEKNGKKYFVPMVLELKKEKKTQSSQ